MGSEGDRQFVACAFLILIYQPPQNEGVVVCSGKRLQQNLACSSKRGTFTSGGTEVALSM